MVSRSCMTICYTSLHIERLSIQLFKTTGHLALLNTTKPFLNFNNNSLAGNSPMNCFCFLSLHTCWHIFWKNKS
jgi:hypothetical protein